MLNVMRHKILNNWCRLQIGLEMHPGLLVISKRKRYKHGSDVRPPQVQQRRARIKCPDTTYGQVYGEVQSRISSSLASKGEPNNLQASKDDIPNKIGAAAGRFRQNGSLLNFSYRNL